MQKDHHANMTDFGAGNVTRTHDPFITSEVLYRLSYTSIFSSVMLPYLFVLVNKQSII